MHGIVWLHPDFYLVHFLCSVGISREQLNWSDESDKPCSAPFVFVFRVLEKMKFCFGVPRDNIRHSRPPASSD